MAWTRRGDPDESQLQQQREIQIKSENVDNSDLINLDCDWREKMRVVQEELDGVRRELQHKIDENTALQIANNLLQVQVPSYSKDDKRERKLKDKLESKQNKIEELEEDVTSLRERLDEKRDMVRQLKGDKSESEKRLKSLEKVNDELNNENHQLKIKLAHVESRLEQFTAENIKLAATLSSSEADRSQQEAKVKDLAQQLTKYRRKNDELEKTISSKSAKLKRFQKENGVKQSEIIRLRETMSGMYSAEEYSLKIVKLDDLQRKLDTNKSNLAEREEQVDSLNETILSLVEEKNELTKKSEEKIKLLEASLKQAEDENAILTEKNDSFFEDLAMANEELESNHKVIKEQSETVVELRETLQKLTDESDSLVNNLKLELAKTTASLEVSQRKNHENQDVINQKCAEIKTLNVKLFRVKIEDEQNQCKVKTVQNYTAQLEEKLKCASENSSCLEQQITLSKLEIDRLKGQLNGVLKDKADIDKFVKRVGKMLQIEEDLDISCLSRLVMIMKCISNRETEFYNVNKKCLDREFDNGAGTGQSFRILKSLVKKRKKLE